MTTTAIDFTQDEFTAVLAALAIDEIPGAPEALAAPYFDRSSERLSDGLTALEARGLAQRTGSGVAISGELIEAVDRLRAPRTITWAITRRPDGQGRFFDAVGDEHGFTGLIPHIDRSITMVLAETRGAVAGALAGMSGADRAAVAAEPGPALEPVVAERAFALVSAALGAVDVEIEPEGAAEQLLAECVASTSFSFWTVESSGGSTSPREFAVVIARGQSWLVAPAERGTVVLAPIDEAALTDLILGERR